MYLKTTLFVGILLMLTSVAFAQDKIFKKDGSVIEAKILEVGVRTVSYKRIDNQDGPKYTVAKSALDRIEFENGTNEFFDQRSKVRHSPKVDNTKYGNNIIAFFPMLINNGGVGLGLSYERLLGKNTHISFYIPISATFDANNDYYNSSSVIVNGDRNSYSYFAMPGIKIYPTGAKGKVRYGVGPAVALRFGSQANYNPLYDPNGTITYNYTQQNRFAAGAVINNSLNLSPTKRLYLGLELALGFVFYEEIGGVSNNYSFSPYDFDVDEPIAQFGFKIGYRL